MKRWAIIGIIIMMSTALIGIIAIQAYWLNFSISLNESKFNQNVNDALYQVKRKLEQQVTQSQGPSYTRQDKITLGKINNGTYLRREYFFGIAMMDSSYTSGNYLEQQRQRDKDNVLQLLHAYPVEDLIDPAYLHELIRAQLKLRGVDLEFIEGVFSNRKGQMVIYDGHYVSVIGSSPKTSDPGISLPDTYEMPDAQYKVDLFNSYKGALGQLRLLFPNRTQAIWQDSWIIMLGSLLFTGLILFAFSYTIYVIFRQKKISEMKNDFINNMTHEFKTPIATISLATDSLVSDKIIHEPNKIKRFAKIITQENSRMLNQVEKVLQMALIDRGDFELQEEEVHLHELITDAASFIGLQVDQKGGSIEMSLDADEDCVYGDPTHLGNIFHNLLDNANKYSPESPEIQISTRNVSGGLEIRISDKGIGMSPESRKQIFEKFFRVHTGNVHDVKGFGLGLSYVKAIVTAHGGDINVESTLGKGSTFILFIPFNRKK